MRSGGHGISSGSRIGRSHARRVRAAAGTRLPGRTVVAGRSSPGGQPPRPDAPGRDNERVRIPGGPWALPGGGLRVRACCWPRPCCRTSGGHGADRGRPAVRLRGGRRDAAGCSGRDTRWPTGCWRSAPCTWPASRARWRWPCCPAAGGSRRAIGWASAVLFAAGFVALLDLLARYPTGRVRLGLGARHWCAPPRSPPSPPRSPSPAARGSCRCWICPPAPTRPICPRCSRSRRHSRSCCSLPSSGSGCCSRATAEHRPWTAGRCAGRS